MPVSKPIDVVMVMGHPFIMELLRQLGISEQHIGDVTMEWPVAGVLTLTIKALPEKRHLDAAFRKALEAQ